MTATCPIIQNERATVEHIPEYPGSNLALRAVCPAAGPIQQIVKLCATCHTEGGEQRCLIREPELLRSHVTGLERLECAARTTVGPDLAIIGIPLDEQLPDPTLHHAGAVIDATPVSARRIRDLTVRVDRIDIVGVLEFDFSSGYRNSQLLDIAWPVCTLLRLEHCEENLIAALCTRKRIYRHRRCGESARAGQN